MKKKKPEKKKDTQWGHDCCMSAEVFLYKSNGDVMIDLDESTFGISIKFCPWCAKELK